MSRSTIHLEAIDPIEIYGAANKNLEALCSYFPELKVIARGYSVVRNSEGELVSSANNLLCGDIVNILLQDGTATAQITSIKENVYESEK